MKNYLALAIFCLALNSCKNNDTTDENSNAIDTTAIQQNSTDTLSYPTDSTTIDSSVADVDSNGKTTVKLPNKISTTEKVIPGEKGKFPLAETKWGLLELNGKEVEENKRRDYFINFDSKSGRFKAFVGCNTMSGNYFMKSANKLGFSNVITTRKACDKMDIERDFFNNLQKIDSYMIEGGGKVLHLHSGKTRLAKFQAIR